MSFLEEFDLVLSLFTDADIGKAVRESDSDSILEFVETVTILTRHHFPPIPVKEDGYSFVANSSLSGGRHPCGSPGCRLKKLDDLVSFAALYADVVYIQNPFEEIFHRASDGILPIDRDELICGIYNYLLLKPLIEQGVIKYCHNAVHVCKNHFESITSPLADKISRKNAALGKYIESHLEEHCTFTLDVSDDGGQFLKAEGPEAFMDHGVTYLHLYDTFSNSEFAEKYPNLPHKMSLEEVRDNRLLALIVEPIIRDLANQEWHSAFYGTSFLCDNPLQMRLAKRANIRTGSVDSSALNTAFQHQLPVVYSRDYKSLLELRDREWEAFCVYRDSLRSVIGGSENWNEANIEVAFKDVVVPELNKVQKRIKDWKSNTREGLAEKAVIGSGAVAIGLYSGMLPSNLGAIFAAAGGGAALVQSMLEFNKTLKPHQQARDSDYYFLWEANKA